MNHRLMYISAAFVLVLGIAWQDIFTLVIAWFLLFAAAITQGGHSRS